MGRVLLILVGLALAFVLGTGVRGDARRASPLERSRDERPNAHAAPAGSAGAHGDRHGHQSVAATGGDRNLHSQIPICENSELFGGLEQPGEDDRDRAREADPDPQAPTREEEVVGDRDDSDEHEDRRDRSDPDCDEALGNGRRHAHADLAEDDEQNSREPEEQNDLSDGARVPADDRHRRVVAFARVPPRERGHREQQAEQERQATAEAGDIPGAGKPASPQT